MTTDNTTLEDLRKHMSEMNVKILEELNPFSKQIGKEKDLLGFPISVLSGNPRC